MQHTEPIKALSTELNRLSEIAARESLLDLCRSPVSLPEESDAGNPQAGFCEGCAPQGARLLDAGANGYMVEIEWHRRETRRQTEKTNLNL